MPIQCEYFAMEGLTQMIEVIRRRHEAAKTTNLSSAESCSRCTTKRLS